MVSKAAVVLAGGMGTRMTSRIPKVLHKVCGREMLGLVVDSTKSAGFDDVVVVVRPESVAIRNLLGESVRYAVQSEPLGTGHALLSARELLDGVDDVLVINGDVPLIRHETIESVVRTHSEGDVCATLLTSELERPDGMGRVVRDESGNVYGVVEEVECDEHTRSITEVNVGVYAFRTSWLWSNMDTISPNQDGEIYLTEVVSIASIQGGGIASIRLDSPQDAIGINTLVDLASAESVMRERICVRWMLTGVIIPDPSTVYIDGSAQIGSGTVVLPNSHIGGSVVIGRDCEIGPNTIVKDSNLGDGCVVFGSVVFGSELEQDVHVGPFSHVRSGSHLGSGVHLGSSAEVKNSSLGAGTKSGHFSYIGDARIGVDVNIGAGTVTCNYDGFQKNVTRIGDGAMIGSDTMLIAPVTVGANAETGAGSVVNKDVPANSLVKGVPARVNSKRRRTR